MKPCSWILVLFLALVGCQAQTSAERPKEEEPLSLVSHTLLTDRQGKAGSPVELFDYRQRTLHFQAKLSRAVDKANCRWIFAAKETVAGNGRALDSLEGEVSGTDISAEITLKSDWPVGTYHVDVVVDEQPVGGFDFTVTGEKSRIAFLSHALAPDDGTGLPGLKVDAFKFGVKKIHIQVSTKGVDTSKPEVAWRLYQVRGGRDLPLITTKQPPLMLHDSMLKCVFDSPTPWNRGIYRADVFLGGKKAHSILFQVK